MDGVGGGWGAGWMGWGVVGGCPPHMCIHMRMPTHARTCMRGKHDNSMQMAAPIGFGEIPGIPYDVICACMCMCVHVCAHVWGGPCHHPHPHPPNPHPQGGGPPESVKIQ